jgi:hypothetical protein
MFRFSIRDVVWMTVFVGLPSILSCLVPLSACDEMAEIPADIPAELPGAWTDHAGIKHLHIEVFSVYRTKSNVVRDRTFAFVSSDGKRRCDTIETINGVTEREVRSFDGTNWYYWVDLGVPGQSFLGEIYPPGVEVGDRLRIVDIRQIGLVPQSTLSLSSTMRFPDLRDRKSVDKNERVIGGRPMTVLTVELKDGLKREYCIDKHLNNAVVTSRLLAPNVGMTQESTTQETQTILGHVLPRKLIYKQVQNGLTISEETVELKVISLDKEFSPVMFTLAGFGLPWGILFQERVKPGAPLKKHQMWNGQELVPRP